MKFHPHQFTRKICHWSYCRYCGLMYLNNDASRKEAKKSCKGQIED